MGIDGEEGIGPGHFSVLGRAGALGEAAAARDRRDVVLLITGGSGEGGRDRSDSDVNPPEAEYGR